MPNREQEIKTLKKAISQIHQVLKKTHDTTVIDKSLCAEAVRYDLDLDTVAMKLPTSNFKAIGDVCGPFREPI